MRLNEGIYLKMNSDPQDDPHWALQGRYLARAKHTDGTASLEGA